MRIRLPCLLLLLALPLLSSAEEGGGEGSGWHRLVGILQYLQADYPAAVESQSEFELAEQRSFITEAVQAARELGPEGQPFVQQLTAIQARVDKGEDPQGVSRDCGALVEEVVKVSGLARSPRRVPDLAVGAQVYQQACAACHGADGQARVPAADTMEPRPTNFHDEDVMAGLTPYKAFNTTSFGVPELAKAWGAEHLPCLRRKLPEADQERALMSARLAAESKSPRFQEEGRALLGLLDEARRGSSGAASLLSVLWLTVLILLREGFEASIIVAALLAMLRKMGQPSYVRLVHAGWLSALGVGAVLFVFGRHLLSGANRELMEGMAALVAVGMLVYAALWLNARANMSRFMGELRQKMQGALGSGSGVGLFLISFTAVLRESVETAIFLQGLALDSAAGVAWGSLVGAVALVALVLLVNRVGYVLPWMLSLGISSCESLAAALTRPARRASLSTTR